MEDETIAPPRRRGRPATYLKRATIVAAVAGRVGRGESLRSVFADREAGMPARSLFMHWLARDPDLRDAYRLARRLHGQVWDPTPGRPVSYNERAAQAICEGISEGEFLEDVCRLPGMPKQATVYRWLAAKPEFAKAYGEARQVQAHRLFDEALRVAETAMEKTWRKAKLRVDTIRWTVAKLAPHRYGPRPKVEVEPTRQFWNIYLQQYGEPRESAKLVSSQELNGKGNGLLDPDDDED